MPASQSIRTRDARLGLLGLCRPLARSANRLAIVIGAVAALTGGCAGGRPVVQMAPPAVRGEVRPPRPSSSYVWMPGHWRWRDGRHAWVPGRWIEGRPGKHWVPGHWKRAEDGWVWEPGRWASG